MANHHPLPSALTDETRLRFDPLLDLEATSYRHLANFADNITYMMCPEDWHILRELTRPIAVPDGIEA